MKIIDDLYEEFGEEAVDRFLTETTDYRDDIAYIARLIKREKCQHLHTFEFKSSGWITAGSGAMTIPGRHCSDCGEYLGKK